MRQIIGFEFNITGVMIAVRGTLYSVHDLIVIENQLGDTTIIFST